MPDPLQTGTAVLLKLLGSERAACFQRDASAGPLLHVEMGGLCLRADGWRVARRRGAVKALPPGPPTMLITRTLQMYPPPRFSCFQSAGWKPHGACDTTDSQLWQPSN